MGDDTTEVDDAQLGEHFWGCELSRDNPSVTFSSQEEDEDSDFMHHTLFIKQAVLGAQAVKDEVNIVSIETQNFDKETIKQPFFSLTRGENSMCYMDISFTDKCPVTFTLSDGTGPIYISAIQLVEFPEEEGDQTMDEEGLTEEEESPERPKLKANKRKGDAAGGASKAKQRSKIEASAADDDEEDSDEEDEDDDDEDDDDEEMDDEDDEPSPEKKKGGKKKNAKAGGKAAAKKAEKPKKKVAPTKKSKK